MPPKRICQKSVLLLRSSIFALIVPLDMQTISNSIKKKPAGVLVAHEDLEFVGLGAEIAAQIADPPVLYLAGCTG